jgi:hypothetical protein
MLKLSIYCARFETNYSTCTSGSSENICSSSGGAALRKKGRQDETQFTTKMNGFLSFTPPLNANVLFCRLFFDLTLCTTKLRVLGLCLSYFTGNSIVTT